MRREPEAVSHRTPIRPRQETIEARELFMGDADKVVGEEKDEEEEEGGRRRSQAAGKQKRPWLPNHR